MAPLVRVNPVSTGTVGQVGTPDRAVAVCGSRDLISLNDGHCRAIDALDGQGLVEGDAIGQDRKPPGRPWHKRRW